MKRISLNGNWFYKSDPESKLNYDQVLKHFWAKKINDRMKIPSNWQLQGLENYCGSVWFIKPFVVKENNFDRDLRVIEFHGADYFADVWLNDIYLGSHEGYFQKFIFDVTGKVKDGSNLLVVKINSPFEDPQTIWPNQKRVIKGIFSHHDCRPGGTDPLYGQDQNTGGIWNNVDLVFADELYVKNVKITSKLFEQNKHAKVFIEIESLSNVKQVRQAEFQIKITSPSNKKKKHSFPVSISPGENIFQFVIDVIAPDLWWSWDLGEQNLYLLNLIMGNNILDSIPFGIRQVELREEVFYLNGKRLFLRGTNIIPEQQLSKLDAAKISKQIGLIKEANINAVRVHAHVNRKEFYDACDKHGIIVWQDFALQWTYDESNHFITNAIKQIRDMVKLLYNHPSIAFWCCHNEPGSQINTLDKFLFDSVSKEDNSRIIRIASNYEEHPYDGWYWGDMEHFASTPMGPMVTEFGAQAVPELSSLRRFIPARDLFPPNWKKWKYHNFQYDQTFKIAGVERGRSINEFITNSQTYQAKLIKTAVDFYRREKFGRANGIFQFMFIDCWPSITWSVVDYYFKKKKGYAALKQCYQPLYISIKVRQKYFQPGDKLNIEYWVINDLHKKFSNCNLVFSLEDKLLAKFSLDRIESDSVTHTHFESINILLPVKIKTGKKKVDVELTDNEKRIISQNDFEIEIKGS